MPEPIKAWQICYMCHLSANCGECCMICKDQCNSKQSCMLGKPHQAERWEGLQDIINDPEMENWKPEKENKIG